MRIPGFKTAKHFAKWLRNRVSPGSIVLGYHRVASAEYDSYENCISPDHFDEQMEVLSRYANPVSLETLIERLALGDLLPKTVCVTIDDGYADTLIYAKPVLEKYKIPATVFVTTGNLGGEFWWDEIERTILQAPGAAGPLRLAVNQHVMEWNIASLSVAERCSQVVSIANWLRPLNDPSRHQGMDQIREWAGIDIKDKSTQARSMTPDELVDLANGELIHIGSHSVTHPMLPALTELERRYEMEESKRTLEKILAEPVYGFSYPNGRYLERDLDIASQSGYRCACTSQNGTIRSGHNLYQLPRFWPGNIDGNSFLRWLKLWL